MKSSFFCSLLFVAAALQLSSSQQNAAVMDDPFSTGPLLVNSTSFRQIINPLLDTNLVVFSPNEPGSFPVLYFVTGFAGMVPALAYSEYFSHIASHGFVVVGVWKEEMPLHSFDPSWFNATIDFVENNLETSLHLQGINRQMHVDYEQSFLGGHSAGSHVPIVQLETHCMHFIGMVLSSPVDGADPWGLLNVSVITTGSKVNFNVPMLQMVTGLDPIPTGSVGPACAPEAVAGHHFFDAMNGPSWFINSTAYGHGDILNPNIEQFVENSQFCSTDPQTPKEPYISFVAGETVSFMKGVLDPINNCAYFDFLETAGILGINTAMEHAPNGWERCTLSQCRLTPISN